MKKTLLIAVFVVLALRAGAQSPDFTLFLGAGLGVLNGRAEEIVYSDEVLDTKLSQLLWDMKNIPFAGLNLEFNWLPEASEWGFFADAGVKLGIAGPGGVMEDRDWMIEGYPDFLTHYSVHDNEVKTARIIDARAGYSFRTLGVLLLKPFIAYEHMSFEWSATGGSFLYPEVEGGHGYFYPETEVCTYRQTWNTLALGLSLYGEFNPYFDAEVTLALSPLVWCSAEDQHLLRDLVITADLFWGLFFEPALLFTFRPGNNFRLSLSLAAKNIGPVRGDSVYTESGTVLNNIPDNIAGAGFSTLEAGIYARFTLLGI